MRKEMAGKFTQKMFTEDDLRILRIMSEDLPIERRPYKVMAERAGTGEDDILASVRKHITSGIIRKFRAVLAHRKAGIEENALIVWSVCAGECERMGHFFSSHRAVTHCYERTPPFLGKYNLFTMVHGREGEMNKIVKKLSRSSGISDYVVLFSEEEFKKERMDYFANA